MVPKDIATEAEELAKVTFINSLKGLKRASNQHSHFVLRFCLKSEPRVLINLLFSKEKAL